MKQGFELSDLDKSNIEESIKKFESLTSGEIRVHFDVECEGNPMDRAIEIFNKLNLFETKQRNAILFYFSINDKKMAIIGDKGINELVPLNFWDESRDLMIHSFKENKIIEGVIAGILKAGEALAKYFPSMENDDNEIDNEVTFGDEV